MDRETCPEERGCFRAATLHAERCLQFNSSIRKYVKQQGKQSIRHQNSLSLVRTTWSLFLITGRGRGTVIPREVHEVFRISARVLFCQTEPICCSCIWAQWEGGRKSETCCGTATREALVVEVQIRLYVMSPRGLCAAREKLATVLPPGVGVSTPSGQIFQYSLRSSEAKIDAWRCLFY